MNKLVTPAVALLLPLAAVAQQGITVYSSGTVEIGTTRQLSAYVPLSPATITWSVNGVAGGNSTFGTISASGLYTAPTTVPMSNIVTVQATSTAYPTKYGTVSLTIIKPMPWIWSVSPSTISAGTFNISLNGANYRTDSIVKLAGTPLTTTYVSSTSLKATGTVSTSQVGATLAVTVTNPDPGGSTSQPLNIKVGAPVISVSITPASATVKLQATQKFTATVANTTNTAVTWSVNGVNGGSATTGTIDTTGLYTAPATFPSSNTVTVRATSAASTTASASALVTLQSSAPPPPPVNLSHARFLDQATFGPTPADLAHIAQIGGINPWLQEQFAMAETPIPLSASTSQAKADYLWRLAHAPDQLRQRVAYALGAIWVVSMNKNIYPNEMIPFLQILSRNAFGNYRTLMGEVTRSPQMGKYLDLANSNRPGLGSGANENYPRELMQLFTIGLTLLNPDGSTASPNPTYLQKDVQQVALALTGWTYPTAAGATPQSNNWENFSQPAMEPREANHDTTAKAFLNCSLPANQTVNQDTDGVLDCLFQHPNIAPFVSVRLIRSLVASNPSPAYIQRISNVFSGANGGQRGDLKAVVTAILTDAEARNDAGPPDSGRLRDALQFTTALIRVLNGQVSTANTYSWAYQNMSQMPLTPNSVFAFYSPLYRIPRSPLFGPEFQIYSATDSLVRANFSYQVIWGQMGSDVQIDVSPYMAVATDIPSLIDRADNALLYHRMPAAMKTSLTNALNTASSDIERVRLALYFTSLAGQFAVQY